MVVYFGRRALAFGIGGVDSVAIWNSELLGHPDQIG